jgi:hypothetical protein
MMATRSEYCRITQQNGNCREKRKKARANNRIEKDTGSETIIQSKHRLNECAITQPIKQFYQ